MFIHANLMSYLELDQVKVNGRAEFKRSKFESLIVNGTLKFKDLIVSNIVEVHGATNGENIECQNFIVYGSLEGNNIKVMKSTIVNGALNIENSFLEELKIDSKKIILNNSSTKKIIVTSPQNNIKQQLFLKGKTTINGDIIFESGLGEILIDKQVSITGKIIGGNIISLKSTES